MHALIVYAHPEHQSFTAALRDSAVKAIHEAGWTCEVSDLFAEEFNPVIGRHDFREVKNPNYFSIQEEQTHAETLTTGTEEEAGGYSDEIAREQQRVSRADLVLFIFPMWWGGPPAVVKGWFDRVMSYGFSYADGIRFDRGYFRGRKAMVCVSTGGTVQRFSDEGTYGEIWRVLWPLQHCGIKYMGYDLLDPFVAYGAARLDDDQRKTYLEDWEQHLQAAMQATEGDTAPQPIERGSVEVRPLQYTRATDSGTPARIRQ